MDYFIIGLYTWVIGISVTAWRLTLWMERQTKELLDQDFEIIKQLTRERDQAIKWLIANDPDTPINILTAIRAQLDAEDGNGTDACTPT